MSDPRGAVIEHLTAPAAARRLQQAQLDDREAARPVAVLASGKAYEAARSTIRFLKERGDRDHRLFAVTFDDVDDRSWFCPVAAERDESGAWAVRGVAASCGEEPQRSEPWLNFCGSWGKGRLYGGGRVHAAGAKLDRVRLTLANGTQLEDDADGEVALFVTDQAAEPVTVDIYDRAGRLVASHGPH